MIRNQLHSSFPIIQAAIDGVQQGQIFKNAHQDYWILHKAGFSEVFLNDDGRELVDFIIENHDLPKYFHIYDPPEVLVEVFKSRSEIFNTRERNRVQLRYEGRQKESDLLYSLPDEFTITTVTQANVDSLDVFNLDLANKFWNGKDEFVKKSLGIFLKDKKDNPVSLCYAAAVAGQKAEIDVVTSEHHRGRGLAKSVVSSFISNCINSKIVPNWDCFEDNTASLMIAKNLNFILSSNYKFISIFKKDMQ